MSDWKNVQYKDGKFQTGSGGGGGSSTFADLDDVSFSNLQNGQVPKYNSTTQKWENANESGGGGTVTDVQVDGVSVVNQQGVAEIETPNADVIEYDNQQSGLQATNMQDAIDELAQGSGGGGVEDVEVNGTSVVNAQKVAEIKSYKEVTQAEYNALPAGKESDGVLYCIKDAPGGIEGFPPLIYSDEEREVGVWLDGKPLYQRTFVVQKTTVGTETLLDLSSLNIESCVQTTGWFINSGGTHSYIPYYTSSSDFTIAYYQGGILKGYNGGNHTKSIWNITLQYTKTTDTAGSGTWTAQGALAHHYSTTEHVIGTWIDGKPVYEIVKPITTTSGNYNFDVSSLNIDFLVDLKIQIKNVNVGSYVNGAYWQASNDYFNYYMQSRKQIITFRSGSGYSYGTGHIILQYTKTTD